MMPSFSDTVFVFDLDDTLYSEYEYVLSCFEFVSKVVEYKYGIQTSLASLKHWYLEGEKSPIQKLWKVHALPGSEIAGIIDVIREHVPSIHLFDDAARLLEKIRSANRPFAIVTDGRSTTQRAKLQALNCLDAAYISISEENGLSKTDVRRFTQVSSSVKSNHYIYVGDNPKKDFLAPNLLGWTTIMRVHEPQLIHSQVLDKDFKWHPNIMVRSLDEIFS